MLFLNHCMVEMFFGECDDYQIGGTPAGDSEALPSSEVTRTQGIIVACWWNLDDQCYGDGDNTFGSDIDDHGEIFSGDDH